MIFKKCSFLSAKVLFFSEIEKEKHKKTKKYDFF